MSSVESAGDMTWRRVLLIIALFLAIVVGAGVALIVFSDVFASLFV